MMSSGLMTVLMAILFFMLTPGVLVSLPPGCDMYTTAVFHAIAFSLIWMLIKNPIYSALYPGVARVVVAKKKSQSRK